MGCPNWQYDSSNESTTEVQENRKNLAGSGIIMIAHIGCGVWTKRLSDMLYATTKMINGWTRCFVDGCCLIHEARFCAPDSQSSDSFPLSTTFSATTIADSAGNNQILLLPTCCGRFIFVSLIVKLYLPTYLLLLEILIANLLQEGANHCQSSSICQHQPMHRSKTKHLLYIHMHVLDLICCLCL